MKIEHINEFVVLCETLNFTKAAKRLYITQPVLSTHINALEKDLGVILFARDQHRVRLTKMGELVLEESKKLIAQYDGMIERIENEKNGMVQALRIGYLHHAYKKQIGDIIQEFNVQHSNVAISIYAYGYSELMKALYDGEIDLALTIDCDEDAHEFCEIVNLKSEKLVLAVSSNSPLAEQEVVSLSQLESIPLLFPDKKKTGRYAEYLEGLFHLNGIKPNISGLYMDVFSRMAAVENADTHAIVMEHFLAAFDNALTGVPLSGKGWRIEMAALWKKSNTNASIRPAVHVIEEEYSS